MLKYIIGDLINNLIYIPWGLLGFFIIYLILLSLKKVNVIHLSMTKLIRAGLFIGYVLIILCLTFLFRENGSVDVVDFDLFSTWGRNNRNHAYFVENILLFIPFGYLLPGVFERIKHFALYALTGMAFSIVIEVMQHITKRGCFQIDDVITNTCGGIIGYLIFFVIFRKFSRKS